MPPQYVARIGQARIFGSDGHVISPDNLLLTDLPLDRPVTRREMRRLLPGLTPEDAARARATLADRVMNRGPLPRPTRCDACVAVLTTAFHDNYYHWTIDVLPRLMLFAAAGWKPDLYYVPTDAAFQRESLALLGIDAERCIPATRHGHVAAREVLVASEVRAIATEEVCDFLCAQLRAPALEKTRPSGRKRIYISRGHARWRRVTNEDEVAAFLARHGFESVTLEEMSLTEQIRLLHDAEFVVGPHGAGLTNTVYCRPGTRVLELSVPRHPIPWFHRIAICRGLRYVNLIAGEGGSAWRRAQQADIHVPLKALERGLEVLEEAER